MPNTAFVARNVREYEAALEHAERDGSIRDWTMGMLCGLVAPIGTCEYDMTFSTQTCVLHSNTDDSRE